MAPQGSVVARAVVVVVVLGASSRLVGGEDFDAEPDEHAAPASATTVSAAIVHDRLTYPPTP